MNPIKIEKGAVEAIKRIIRLHEKMDESLSEADKNPSWDGHIYLYTNSDLKVEHMLGRIPIQVKGKNDESLFNKETITYPVKYKFLRNYSVDGGVVYFVVIISDDGEKAAIFYNNLTPNKLESLLKGSKEKKPNQTKSISLINLKNNDKNELYNILVQFGYECGKIAEVEKGASYKTPKEYIHYVAGITKRLINVVSDYCTKEIINENALLQSNIGIKYIPSPFEIAKFFGIRVIFFGMGGEAVSFFDRSKLIIYISDKYFHNEYSTRILVAHELGHFFLDDNGLKTMKNYNTSYGFPIEVRNEYVANIFTILLMPQIMAGCSWEKLSPDDLNNVISQKIKIL